MRYEVESRACTHYDARKETVVCRDLERCDKVVMRMLTEPGRKVTVWRLERPWSGRCWRYYGTEKRRKVKEVRS